MKAKTRAGPKAKYLPSPRIKAKIQTRAAVLAEVKVQLVNAEGEARYWRERCARYEAHHARLVTSGVDVRAAVERFQIVLDHAAPKGTERRANDSDRRT